MLHFATDVDAPQWRTGIIATFRNLKRPTHHSNRILMQVICNELIFSSYGREKMPIAFFNTSRSCRKSSFSRCKRRFSSSRGGRCPLPGKASLPCSAKRKHQWLSVLSGIPKSRAIWDCDFPLACHRCTASSLNSFVYVGLAFCMILTLSGEDFSSHVPFSIPPGQDH